MSTPSSLSKKQKQRQRVIRLLNISIVAATLAVIGALSLIYRFPPQLYQWTHGLDQKSTAVVPSPTLIQRSPALLSMPATLDIPTLHINAPIEPVGKDVDGNMDTPRNPQFVAWYEPGTRPGEVGNAVFAGHVDDVKGQPAVFSKLNTLKIGDVVKVKTVNNVSSTFKVTAIKEYPYDKAPLEEIFGETKEKHLNLITCKGTWNKTTQNYSHRLVIYTTLDDHSTL